MEKLKLISMGENPPLDMQDQKTFFSKKIETAFHLKTNDTDNVTGRVSRGKGISDYFENQ